MKYVMLIYQAENAQATATEESMSKVLAEYTQFGTAIRESGQYLAGERLKPIATATTVRVRDGKTLTTDGPFAETREQLAGFIAIEAENLDDAIAIAARVPSAKFGSIEVRPIWVMGAPAAA